MPGYVAALLVVWTGLASVIQLFSGIVIGVIPALMLLAARVIPESRAPDRMAQR